MRTTRSSRNKLAEASKVDVVGVGLNATDTIISVPHHPERGSKVEAASVKVFPGGQVASAIIACQKWGLKTRYVGKLGDDPAAAEHRQEFARSGVEAQIITAEGCASHQSFILVDSSGERTVVRRQDEKLELQPHELKREWISNARALLVDGYDTAVATIAAKWAREGGIPVIADFDDTYPEIKELMRSVDYLIVSRDFPEMICGDRDLKNSLPLLHSRFRYQMTAATLGSDGVLAWDGQQFHHACAYQVPVVDTTGAGDIFHAAFIYALLRGWPLQRQLEFACAAAALNCTATGARGGIRTIDEIENLMASGARHPVYV
ncbi:MAG TPA: PfkB family carbohydrate kinase [Terriglobales bacterium]|jgi:sulfofructose kinase|nr:PfkB family carbohydrate kinase [Terriglobales bacterium]